ncbi:family 1 glycosylhydrolase [Streptomyces sp. enrichment culture]|uniref:family 1 glycosylhydrolase n=1 Tax=Streptomyces sp. enrichment culture TaxID=1795815 RepID=UPI003F565C38
MDTYRFSIARPRVQHSGEGPVNPEGPDFAERLVDDLLEAGVTPVVTLHRWAVGGRGRMALTVPDPRPSCPRVAACDGEQDWRWPGLRSWSGASG